MPRGRGLGQKTLERIAIAQELLARMAPMSVRGVSYAFFIRKLTPSMDERETKKMSTLLTTAREVGLVDWADIVDETRQIEWQPGWDDSEAFIDSVAAEYRRDRWQDQAYRLLVISEKGTVGGVLRPVLEQYGVAFLVVHGWASATTIRNLATLSRSDQDRPLVLIYVGDHDPSGRFMSYIDLPRRLREYGGEATITRVALDPVQIEACDLPTFSVFQKKTDTRFRWFLDTHGEVCAELDALDPNVLRALVEDQIIRHIDQETWQRAEDTEQKEITSLRDFLADYHGLEEQKDEQKDEDEKKEKDKEDAQEDKDEP